MIGIERGEKFLLSTKSRQHHFFNGDGELAVDVVVLRQVTDGEFGHLNPISEVRNLAGERFHHAQNNAHKGGFAATVRPDDAKEVVIEHFQRHILQGYLLFVACKYVFNFDDGLFRCGHFSDLATFIISFSQL